MPQRQRLKHRDFSSINTAQGRRCYGTYFTLSVGVQRGAGPSEKAKFAVVVSKKIAARAVDRNRIRRLCKEVVRQESDTIRGPQTLILYAKKAARSASFKEIETDIVELFSQLPTAPIAGYNTRQ